MNFPAQVKNSGDNDRFSHKARGSIKDEEEKLGMIGGDTTGQRGRECGHSQAKRAICLLPLRHSVKVAIKP